MASKSSTAIIPAKLRGKGWLSALLSLVIGLGLGTTVGREVLDSAGVPASCVRAIQRADRALDTGTAVADNGTAALTAAKDLEVGEAIDLLSEAKVGARELVGLVRRFNDARTKCNAARE